MEIINESQHMREGFFRKIGHERGMQAEDSVKRALSRALSTKDVVIPDWLLGYEGVTEKEDARKIDRWIMTDVGKIRLQIKSSLIAAKKFKEEHPDIPVIVVRAGDNDRQIMDRIVSVIGQQRKIYLEERNQ